METVTLHLTDVDHPPHRLAIKQGATYYYPALIYTGVDLREWEFRGQIRTTYASLGGELLANFSFRDVAFSESPSAEDSSVMIPKSTLFPGLSSAVTAGLDPSALKPRADEEASFRPGVNCWVYDIEGEVNGEVVRLAQGFARMSMEATILDA